MGRKFSEFDESFMIYQTKTLSDSGRAIPKPAMSSLISASMLYDSVLTIIDHVNTLSNIQKAGINNE